LQWGKTWIYQNLLTGRKNCQHLGGRCQKLEKNIDIFYEWWPLKSMFLKKMTKKIANFLNRQYNPLRRIDLFLFWFSVFFKKHYIVTKKNLHPTIKIKLRKKSWEVLTFVLVKILLYVLIYQYTQGRGIWGEGAGDRRPHFYQGHKWKVIIDFGLRKIGNPIGCWKVLKFALKIYFFSPAFDIIVIFCTRFGENVWYLQA